MHSEARRYSIILNTRIENRIEHLYLDVKGLVTVGIGNLFDVEKKDDAQALKIVTEELVTLPFVYKDDGKPATKANIEAEWKLVKKKQESAKAGHTAFTGITKLKLDEKAINALYFKKHDEMETKLKRQPDLLDFDKWPADAQLGLLSMAWALGPAAIHRGWPNFNAACRKQNFDAAADHCEISSANNRGVVERNHANRDMFKNAAAVIAGEGQNFAGDLFARARLHYPQRLMKPMTIRD